jgi:hypothetical protein
MSAQLHVLDELGLELARALERQAVRNRPSRRLVAVAVAGALVAGGGAAAAAGLLPTGSPVRGPSRAEVPPAMTPLPGSARIASLRVDDPYGGGPWGVRLVQTQSGRRCVAAGRVQDAQLGAIGKDGRFHALPLRGTGTCGDLRTDPLIFDVAVVPDPTRSATVVSGLGTSDLAGVTATYGGRSTDLPLSDGAFLAVYRGNATGALSVVARFHDGSTRIVYREKGR